MTLTAIDQKALADLCARFRIRRAATIVALAEFYRALASEDELSTEASSRLGVTAFDATGQRILTTRRERDVELDFLSPAVDRLGIRTGEAYDPFSSTACRWWNDAAALERVRKLANGNGGKRK